MDNQNPALKQISLLQFNQGKVKRSTKVLDNKSKRQYSNSESSKSTKPNRKKKVPNSQSTSVKPQNKGYVSDSSTDTQIPAEKGRKGDNNFIPLKSHLE